MRLWSGWLAAVAIPCALLAEAIPAGAGETVVECEYVGERENLPGIGSGDLRTARPTRARFAGAHHSLAEGPPAGSGGPDYSGLGVYRLGYTLDGPGECSCDSTGLPDPYSDGVLKERFATRGGRRVVGPGGSSVHGLPVFQNTPSCFGEDAQSTLSTSFLWTFAVERRVTGNLQVELCLDIRKCQEEDDALGQSMTMHLPDFRDEYGYEAPLVARVVHHRGRLWHEPGLCVCEDADLAWLRTPVLRRAETRLLPWESLLDPVEGEELEHVVAFIGRDCLSLSIENLWQVAPQDFITVEVLVPASARSRVRASADAAALCYLGTRLPGEPD